MSIFSEFAGNVLDWMEEELLPWVILLIIGLVVLILVGGGIYLWKSAQSPTFTLRKDEWQCTLSHEQQTVTYIQTGKVLVPMTTSHKECDQWTLTN